MSKKIKICIIGGGNISNTRHIPALRKIKNVEIVGVISSNPKKLDYTCKKQKIVNKLLVNDPKNDIKKVEKCEWFKEVDAVVIGAPPQQHYPLVKMSLLLKKDVLVEKPMTMNEDEAQELIDLANKNKLIFSVVHNFNYTSGMNKINKIIEEKNYGDILSITEVQFTNRERRLPHWYNELPLGLFYDEAAHFIYLLERHGGKINIKNAYAIYNDDKNDKTPRLMSVSAIAGQVPVHMFLNFNSPVCEWKYIVNFRKRIVIYDLFRDIVIDLPTDNEHYSKDILKNDLSKTFQFWLKFIKSGFKMITGNLLYGHEIVLKHFIDSIETRKVDPYLTGNVGKDTVKYMNQIIGKVNKR